MTFVLAYSGVFMREARERLQRLEQTYARALKYPFRAVKILWQIHTVLR